MRFSCEKLQRNLLQNLIQFQFVLLIILSAIWLEIYQVLVFCVYDLIVFVYWIKVTLSWIFCKSHFECCVLVIQGRLHESSAVCASFTCIWILTPFTSLPWNCAFFFSSWWCQNERRFEHRFVSPTLPITPQPWPPNRHYIQATTSVYTCPASTSWHMTNQRPNKQLTLNSLPQRMKINKIGLWVGGPTSPCEAYKLNCFLWALWVAFPTPLQLLTPLLCKCI